MKRTTAAEAAQHGSPAPNGPTVSVYFGHLEESQGIGLVRLSVEPGCGMAEHRHNGSDIILAPLTGHVVIREGEAPMELHPGDAGFVGKDEAVSLSNPGDRVAEVLVAAGPASFIANILRFPEA